MPVCLHTDEGLLNRLPGTGCKAYAGHLDIDSGLTPGLAPTNRAEHASVANLQASASLSMDGG